MAYYIGVDIGGTNIKTGVISENGEIISEASVPTGADRPQDVVLQDIIRAVKTSIEGSKVDMSEIKAIGMGSPGVIDVENGIVTYNNNLGWRNFAIGPKMSAEFNIPAKLVNDADAAALGEVVAGSAKGAKSAMIITLGTGVGSGFVIDEKIFSGCEFGHMVIAYGGRKCTCGRHGCFEAYCSATGLINMTKEAIAEHPNSTLAEIAKREGVVSGHTVFVAADEQDPIAINIINEYTGYLACGLANLINGLQPEVISIGGGIGKQGERLLVPLREKVIAEVYEGIKPKCAKIVSCTLGYKAGLIGAAMAARD
ncbi:MAG: ROK family protein [Synergistaceae bacterium]|nr:ROK family protein [Synergistaceae bacterium]